MKIRRETAVVARKAQSRLLELIGSGWTTQAIHVAAELRVADMLATGPRHADELAAEIRCDGTALHRLLRALASLGLCEHRVDDSFGLTPCGALLRSGDRASLRSWAIWWGRYLWPNWSNLLQSARTGASARTLATGQAGYAHVEGDRDAAAVFNSAMVELTRLVAEDVARLSPFSRARTVVDVGGGHGELLAAMLAANPALHGTLFDLPHAAEGGRALLRDAGLAERGEVSTGDFFQAVPRGADVYLLKSVLHNWNDDQCLRLLGNCLQAMPPQGALILIERLMPKRTRNAATHRALARTDLNMLVGLGGRERTLDEFRALLRAAGFRISRTKTLAFELSAIEAAPTTRRRPRRSPRHAVAGANTASRADTAI
jgi:hypothetical protein